MKTLKLMSLFILGFVLISSCRDDDKEEDNMSKEYDVYAVTSEYDDKVNYFKNGENNEDISN